MSRRGDLLLLLQCLDETCSIRLLVSYDSELLRELVVIVFVVVFDRVTEVCSRQCWNEFDRGRQTYEERLAST